MSGSRISVLNNISSEVNAVLRYVGKIINRTFSSNGLKCSSCKCELYINTNAEAYCMHCGRVYELEESDEMYGGVKFILTGKLITRNDRIKNRPAKKEPAILTSNERLEPFKRKFDLHLSSRAN